MRRSAALRLVRSLRERERMVVQPTPLESDCTVLRASYTETVDGETTILDAAERSELESSLKHELRAASPKGSDRVVGHLDLVCDDGRTMSFRVRDGGLMSLLGHARRQWPIPAVVQRIMM